MNVRENKKSMKIIKEVERVIPKDLTNIIYDYLTSYAYDNVMRDVRSTSFAKIEFYYYTQLRSIYDQYAIKNFKIKVKRDRQRKILSFDLNPGNLYKKGRPSEFALQAIGEDLPVVNTVPELKGYMQRILARVCNYSYNNKRYLYTGKSRKFQEWTPEAKEEREAFMEESLRRRNEETARWMKHDQMVMESKRQEEKRKSRSTYSSPGFESDTDTDADTDTDTDTDTVTEPVPVIKREQKRLIENKISTISNMVKPYQLGRKDFYGSLGFKGRKAFWRFFSTYQKRTGKRLKSFKSLNDIRSSLRLHKARTQRTKRERQPIKLNTVNNKRFYKQVGVNTRSEFWGTLKEIKKETGKQFREFKNVKTLKNVMSSFIKRKKRKENAKKIRKNKAINKLLSNNKFGSVLRQVKAGNLLLDRRQATTFVNKIIGQGKNVFSIKTSSGEKMKFFINDSTKSILIEYLTEGLITKLVETPNKSDMSHFLAYIPIKEVKFMTFSPPKRVIKNKNGRFFGFINTTNINLLNYQIFNQDQAYNEDIKEPRQHCLFYTLLNSGVKANLVNSIKLAYLTNASISKKDLNKISKIIGYNIVLHYFNSNEKCNKIYKKIYKSNKPNDPQVNIAIYKEHFFKYEETKYSRYSINNYETVKDEKDYWNITKKRKNSYDRRPGKFKINSLLMIHKLFQKGYFKVLDMSRFVETATIAKIKKHIYLNNIKNEQREFELKNKKENKNDIEIYYADCESYVNDEYHKLQLLGYVANDNDNVNILNVNDDIYQNKEVEPVQLLVYKWLKDMTKNGRDNVICYFHNLKYDYHILEEYLNIRDRCEKDNILYSVKIKYKNVTVELRDSYKLLPFALKKFSSNFKLSDEYNKKEAIAYDYYTPENNNKRININDYIKLLPNDEKEIFYNEMKQEPSYDEKTKTFNPLSYYKEYLRLDCLVLKKGMLKFEKIINDITDNELSIFECLTISSLTDRYMKINGAYDDVYEVKGNLREYIGRAVYGGRVCANKKYQKKVIEGKLSDYDGVSLYPSAINRLCREKGLPTGPATRFTKDDIKTWKNKTYSILTVKINKVNKKQQMPFIAHKNEGSILYTNEPPTEPIIIDSTTLEDYIKFHEIDYELLDGVYWTGEGNKTMGHLIQKLFKERLKHKKTNKALANTLKLMLNSSYGKTIMKKTYNKKIIMQEYEKKYNKETKKWSKGTNDTFNNYLYNNFNTIKQTRKIGKNKTEILMRCIDDSYNRAHIGCAILSYSKRIMNEVFGIANDNNLPIYYTDTDSLHCNFKDIPTLETEYRKTYNKELTGKQLEQFHTDFDLTGAVSEIYAIKSIFLGKKSYIDYLESTDKNGNIINGYHIRLKGITVEGLNQAAKEHIDGYMGLYEDLANGMTKDIILNPYDPEKNKNKVLFEFKQGRVRTRAEFRRRVKF